MLWLNFIIVSSELLVILLVSFLQNCLELVWSVEKQTEVNVIPDDSDKKLQNVKQTTAKLSVNVLFRQNTESTRTSARHVINQTTLITPVG